MKKKFYLLSLLPLLCLTSCGSSAYNSAANHIKAHLKSPSSYNMLSASGYENDDFKAFLIVFEADNSFGVPIKATVYTAYTKDDGELYCSMCDPIYNYSKLRYYVAKDQGKEIYSK